MAKLIDRWQRFVLKGFKSGHTVYRDTVKALFKDGWRWLDAGGGWHVFCDLDDGEHEVVARAKRAAVCDTNEASLAKHVSMSERILCDLTSIPVPDNSFDFVSCSMVVEHLPDPEKVFKELHRVLDRDGTLLVHTVNVWSYPTLLAMATQMIPTGLRTRMIAAVTGRKEDDIFPTFYRCNTRGKMRKHMMAAGLEVEEVKRMASGPIFGAVPPICALEALWVKMALTLGVGGVNSQLLARARKRRITAAPPAERVPTERIPAERAKVESIG